MLCFFQKINNKIDVFATIPCTDFSFIIILNISLQKHQTTPSSPYSGHLVGPFPCYVHQGPGTLAFLESCTTLMSCLMTLLHNTFIFCGLIQVFCHIPVQMPYFREVFWNHSMYWFLPLFHTSFCNIVLFLLSLITYTYIIFLSPDSPLNPPTTKLKFSTSKILMYCCYLFCLEWCLRYWQSMINMCGMNKYKIAKYMPLLFLYNSNNVQLLNSI